MCGCHLKLSCSAAVHRLTSPDNPRLYLPAPKERIPRAEVAEAEAIVRRAVLGVLGDLTGLGEEALAHRLHVRVVGSYVRGAPDSGDIDFIIAPPPAAGAVRTGELMKRLYRRLVWEGHVTEDCPFDG